MDLESEKYTVNATFEENDNCTGNSTSKNITLEDVIVEAEVTQTSTQNPSGSQSSEHGSYINGDWVSMSEQEYAERYPVLYHEQALDEGKYGQYHPEM